MTARAAPFGTPATAVAQPCARPALEILCVLGLVGLWIAVWLPRLAGPIDLRWDASTYYVLGTALAEGKGYALLNEPGTIAAVQYPPGLPLLVALHQWALGTADYSVVGHALRLTYFLLSGAYILAAYALVRQWLSRAQAFLAAALIAVSFYGLLHISDTLYAELPFTLASTLFLLCRQQRPRAVFGFLQGVFASLAYLIRSAGIAILIAWTAESFIQRRYASGVLRASVAAILILGWQGWVSHVTSSREYQHPAYSYQRALYNYANVPYVQNSALLDPFRPELGVAIPSAALARTGMNILSIPLALGESVWTDRRFDSILLRMLHVPPSLHGALSWMFRLCLRSIGVLMAFGAVCMVARRDWFLPLFAALAVGLVALAPWPTQYARYFAPLTPVTLVLFVVGLTMLLQVSLRFVTGTAPLRAVAALASTTLAAMLAVSGLVSHWLLENRLLPVSYYDADGQERAFRLLTYDPPWHSLDRAFEWLRANGRDGAIAAGSVPTLMFLRSGHKSVLTPFEPDAARATHLLDEVPVTYLVVDELGPPGITDRYVIPMLASRPGDWRIVFSLSRTKVYERVRGE